MKIASGVEMLELQMQAFGSSMVIHPTLIWDEEGAILIDTGMPGELKQLRAAMEKAGVPFEHLKAVILTHQDIDHIGCLPEILQASASHIKVYAHELDKPFIEGSLPLLKADTSKMSKEALDALPVPIRTLYKNPPHAQIDEVVIDGQELPYCGGIRVIFTPGHTPGHISLYLQQSKTLIVGDATASSNGSLLGPVPRTTPDMETALKSLQKFSDLDVEAVVCYHGGLCKDHVKEQLRALIENNNAPANVE